MLFGMPYTPIVGTLGYVIHPEKDEVLLMHRNAREDDDHLGKYNGLGGKMDPTEDVATCMKREIHEEAGINVVEMQLRGTINWTGFGPKGEDWMGFIFLITRFTGTTFKHCPEGELEWIPKDRINTLPMWEGDRYFLPLIFDSDPRPFHGYMPYQGDKPLGWTFVR
jgi:8-oxo-dGTP diphosphatase